ncbi:MAG: SAM-dependent methyltransferase [Myxococcales bacterium]|nr:SAM-dependent methyltransferase [Myxococcales bacterium]
MPPSRASRFEHEPHALALADYFERGVDAEYAMECEDGARYCYRASRYFALGGRHAPIHLRALERCRGVVWDIGAGVGRHSLVLQERGLAVLAIDSSPGCVAIMKRRGVHNALCLDAFELRDGAADTLLLLDYDVGIAGTSARLRELFEILRARLAPGGQILADGGDGTEPGGASAERSVRARLVYGAHRGSSFEWLYVGSQALGRIAGEAGLACEVLHREPEGRYLARLALPAAVP